MLSEASFLARICLCVLGGNTFLVVVGFFRARGNKQIDIA